MTTIACLPAAVHDIDIDSLPDWLLDGVASGGAVIAAMQPYTIRATAIDQPALVIPLQGRKVVVADGVRTTVGVGEYLMMHRTFKGTVRNLTVQGSYRAWCIAFPWRVIALARDLLDAHAPPPPTGPAVGKGALAPLYDALRVLLALPRAGSIDNADASDAAARATAAIDADADANANADADAALNEAARDHALLGILLALARTGAAQFRLACDPTLAARIRMLVGAAPERTWSSAEIEARLHMSGATLRRRLALEHTSLRVLVREARLDHGMRQLQMTPRPLHAVARACGYRSLPSFRRQFAERFGADPAVVGNSAAA